jgi:UDP-N-acetyl-D-mannosaminuronic acid dehydrogenase
MADIKVACLGLAFKADIDDLRESPAVEITNKVIQLGCQVLGVEPNISELPSKLKAHNLQLSSLQEALDNADVVCVLVKHGVFVEHLADIRAHAQVIDAVGLLA